MILLGVRACVRACVGACVRGWVGAWVRGVGWVGGVRGAWVRGCVGGGWVGGCVSLLLTHLQHAALFFRMVLVCLKTGS